MCVNYFLLSSYFYVLFSPYFSKVFDTVEHSILLEKIELCGIRRVALRLFRCYLRNRMFYVRFGTKNSAKKKMSQLVCLKGLIVAEPDNWNVRVCNS